MARRVGIYNGEKMTVATTIISVRRLTPVFGAEITGVDLTRAYDALPEARKRELEGKVAIHHYAYSRRNMNIKLTNEEGDRRFPPVPQAIIRGNPRHGRKALYVGTHASHNGRGRRTYGGVEPLLVFTQPALLRDRLMPRRVRGRAERDCVQRAHEGLHPIVKRDERAELHDLRFGVV